MLEKNQELFVVKNEINSNDVVGKIAVLSGSHLCYWELNTLNNKYTQSSAYDEMEGVNFSDLTWPRKFLSQKNWEEYNVLIKNLMTHHQRIDCKLALKCEKKWVRVVVEFNSETGILKGIVRDVTSDYITDSALRDRTIELSLFDEGLDNFSIVARTDPKGKIIYANKEFCRLSKFSFEELLGNDHRIVNSGHHSKEFFKEMWDSIGKGVSWRGLIKNKAKDGSFYWVDTIVIPIRDQKGELLEILSFRFDVTLLQSFKEENALLKKQIDELLKTAPPIVSGAV